MRVLLIKTSSMGDVIHALPALTDAGNAIPGIQFDWMVENSFAEIPSWHPLVKNVIPIALRRWRKGIFSRETREGWRQLRGYLSEQKYDLVLDAQGLMKSAFLSFFAHGERVGLDFRSARESFASFAYQRKCTVNFYQHAVVRMRSLFSQALGYVLPDTSPDFGIEGLRHPRESGDLFSQREKYLVFLHGTTWESKQWPEEYWKQLADLVAQAGYRIKLTGGNAEEQEKAKRIANHSSAVDALPRLTIAQMTELLVNSEGAVAVDTGFGHLAAALNLPTVSIYGSTNPEYTGAIGNKSVLLAAQFACAPCLKRTCTYNKTSEIKPACYTNISPLRVWQELSQFLQQT